MWQQVEEEISLSTMESMGIGTFYRVPQFYFDHIESVQAMADDALDALQLSLEAGLGIRDNVKKAYFDRMFYKIQDYRSCRNLQVIYLLLARKIFIENDIARVLLGRELYLWNLLADAALAKGVPAMSITAGRHVGFRLYGRDSLGRQLGMEQTFNALKSGHGGAFDPAAIAQADACYDRFVHNPTRPQHVEKNSRSLLTSVRGVMFGGMKHIRENISKYERNVFDREAGLLDSSANAIKQWPTKALRMYRLMHGNLLTKSPDYSRKFVYLPLHKSPEVTDMFYGDQYAHHESFVFNVAKKLPSDYCLYVKDHTSMIGIRPLSFYAKLKSFYNVEFMHPYVSTFDLAGHSAVTLAVTGTAGWESYLRNRPVVVLGNVFYNFLPDLLHIDLNDPDFTQRFDEYVKTFVPDRDGARCAMRAHYLSSKGMAFDCRDMDALARNAGDYALFTHELFVQWGDWLVENEPAGKVRGGAR